MTLRQRLFVTFGGIVFATTAALAGFLFERISELGARLDSLYSDALLPLHEAQRMSASLLLLQVATLHVLSGTDAPEAPAAYAAARREFQEALGHYQQGARPRTQPTMQALLARHGRLADQRAREDQALATIARDYPALQASADRLVELARTGSRQQAAPQFEPVHRGFDRLGAATATLIALQVEQGALASRETLALVGAARRDFVLAAAAALLCSLAAAMVMSTMVLRPFRALKAATEQIAEGNFEHAIPIASSDEVGQLAAAFNSMARELGRSHRELQDHGRTLEAVVAQRTAELEHAKASLETTVDERTRALSLQARQLSRRNAEAELFAGLDDFLQASTSQGEAYEVVSHIAGRLFDGAGGALYVFNTSRSVVEAVARWGAEPPRSSHFSPVQCWCLRRGRPHFAAERELRCQHVAEADRRYVCVPLVAQGETMGVLHVLEASTAGIDGCGPPIEYARLAKSLAEHMGLAIANLKLRERMRDLSVRDTLTGLFNRRYVDEALDLELERARRDGSKVALLMLDIDHFKRFNDQFGHAGGDIVLRELGRFLADASRRSDIVCRYGGEEFMLVLSAATLEGAAEHAENIRSSVKALSLIDGQRTLGVVSVSIGVAVFPDHAADANRLIKAADAALYRAKRSGRDQVVVCSGRDDTPSGPAPLDPAHDPAAAFA